MTSRSASDRRMTPTQRRNREARRIAKAERDRGSYNVRQQRKENTAARLRQEAADLVRLKEERSMLLAEKRRLDAIADDQRRAAQRAERDERRRNAPVQTAPDVTPKPRRYGGGLNFGMLAVLIAASAGTGEER